MKRIGVLFGQERTFPLALVERINAMGGGDGGWKSVYRVENPQEFFAAYAASAQNVMTLQEEIVFEEYFRCYVIGRSRVHMMRYDPRQPHINRYVRNAPPIDPALHERIRGD